MRRAVLETQHRDVGIGILADEPRAMLGAVGESCADLAGPSGDPAAMSETAFASPIRDFWRTDPIGRASETMAECSALFAAPQAMAAE